MSRLLYIDCVAGAAGDMLLAALLDAGADHGRVRDGIAVLGLDIELVDTERNGLRCAHVEVVAPPSQAPRGWIELRELIDAAGLPDDTGDRAQEVLRRLAEAESRVHGIALEQVHFHELGGLDTVADICGFVLALEDLGIDRIMSSPVPMPRGMIHAAHGRLPLPAPATLELLRDVPMYGVELDVELVTPTGAALLTSFAEGFGPLPAMRLEAIGYGAGSREIASIPNVVRVLVGEAVDEVATATVSLIESNLDDLPGELVPDAAASCFAAGALDVWATPVQMKKGRPGFVLSALARPADERRVAEAILRGTGTLGVRISQLRRWELERDVRTVEVDGEQVRVKVGWLDGEIVNVAPEHDDCAVLAARTGRTVKSVWAAAFTAIQEQIGDELDRVAG